MGIWEAISGTAGVASAATSLSTYFKANSKYFAMKNEIDKLLDEPVYYYGKPYSAARKDEEYWNYLAKWLTYSDIVLSGIKRKIVLRLLLLFIIVPMGAFAVGFDFVSDPLFSAMGIDDGFLKNYLGTAFESHDLLFLPLIFAIPIRLLGKGKLLNSDEVKFLIYLNNFYGIFYDNYIKKSIHFLNEDYERLGGRPLSDFLLEKIKEIDDKSSVIQS